MIENEWMSGCSDWQMCKWYIGRRYKLMGTGGIDRQEDFNGKMGRWEYKDGTDGYCEFW
jgi:hypothetical protein